MVYIGMRHEKKRPCGSSFLPEAAARKLAAVKQTGYVSSRRTSCPAKMYAGHSLLPAQEI